jgi:isopenicillin N synthase-like dioxygenase
MTDGFKDAGFVYIKNHGIPSEIIARVFSESAKFFSRPQEQKDSLAWTTPEANRGYTGHGREKVTNLDDKVAVAELRAAVPDLKESLEIGKAGEPGLPNRWPDKIDNEGEAFKGVMQEFFEICKNLHVTVMRSIGLGMGLIEGFFDQYTDGGDNTLRLLHYPSVPREVFLKNKSQVRAGDHSDYGRNVQVISSSELTILDRFHHLPIPRRMRRATSPQPKRNIRQRNTDPWNYCDQCGRSPCSMVK